MNSQVHFALETEKPTCYKRTSSFMKVVYHNTFLVLYTHTHTQVVVTCHSMLCHAKADGSFFSAWHRGPIIMDVYVDVFTSFLSSYIFIKIMI